MATTAKHEEPVVDAEVVDETPQPPEPAAPSQALERAAPQPPALFLEDPSNPELRLQVASHYATKIADVISKQKLFSRIQGKEHVDIGGWQVAGTLARVAVKIVESGPLRNPVTGDPHVTEYEVRTKDGRTYTVKGWDWYAKAEARLPDGTVVGSSDAVVRRTEDKWATDDDTALLGMAQTRSSSRAYRAALGWIINLAGYATTPSEDMPGRRDHPEGSPAPAASTGPALEFSDPDKLNGVLRAIGYLIGVEPEPAEEPDLDRAKPIMAATVEGWGGKLPKPVASALLRCAVARRERFEDLKGDDGEVAAEQAPDAPGPGTLAQTAENMTGCICTDPEADEGRDDSCPIVGHGIPF